MEKARRFWRGECSWTPVNRSFRRKKRPSPPRPRPRVIQYSRPAIAHEISTRVRQVPADSTRLGDPLAAATQSSLNSAAAIMSPGIPQSVSVGMVARHQPQAQETQAQTRQLREACGRVRGRCAYCYLTVQPQGADQFMYRRTHEHCGSIIADCYAKKKRMRTLKELAPASARRELL